MSLITESNMLLAMQRRNISMKTAVSPQKRTPISNEMFQRIMRRVPYQEGFRFSRGIGDYTGQVATSLEDFAEMLKMVDLKAVEFHMERRDFEKWVVGIFGDEDLAQVINRRKVFQGESRRKELVMAIENYLEGLKKMPKTA
jgi:hypothetical protein